MQILRFRTRPAPTETTSATLVVSAALRVIVIVPSATTRTPAEPAAETDLTPRVHDFLDQRLNDLPFVVALDLQPPTGIVQHVLTELRGIEVSSAGSRLLLVLRCQVRGPEERCQYDAGNGYQTIQCLHSSIVSECCG